MEDKMKTFRAFTLAEVLITLGIIGVVSALTLPTLIGNYQKQVLVNQLRKSYSVLSQAFERMMHEEKAVNFSETDFWTECYHGSSSSQCQNILNKYIKLTNSEYISGSVRAYNTLSCSSSGREYSCYKSNTTNSEYTRGILVSLPDGADVYMNGYTLTIDVNGAQKPNTFGRDLFVFMVSSDGYLNAGNDYYSHGQGLGSLAQKIIEDGWEMNY